MTMRRYETVFVVRPDLGETETKEVAHRLETVVAKEEGTMVKKEEWGIRKLAYDVNHFSKGYYFLFDYVGPARLTNELERYMKISENVLKFLTVKKADHVDMEAIQKEREEEENRREEARRLAALRATPEQVGQEAIEKEDASLAEEEEEEEEEEEGTHEREEETSLEEDEEGDEDES
jgi:small subunit ribosomal protein S6